MDFVNYLFASIFVVGGYFVLCLMYAKPTPINEIPKEYKELAFEMHQEGAKTSNAASYYEKIGKAKNRNQAKIQLSILIAKREAQSITYITYALYTTREQSFFQKISPRSLADQNKLLNLKSTIENNPPIQIRLYKNVVYFFDIDSF